jgi:hypothetical protein
VTFPVVTIGHCKAKPHIPSWTAASVHKVLCFLPVPDEYSLLDRMIDDHLVSHKIVVELHSS